MNWIDVLLLISGIVLILMGMKVGLFRTTFVTIGIILGLVLAAQISDPVAALITSSVGNDSIATVVAYAIVFIAVMFISQLVGRLAKRTAQMLLMGWADNLGGAAIGLVAAMFVGAAIIAVVARLTFLVPENLPGVIDIVEVRQGIEESLVDSSLIPYYLDIIDVVPANTLGMVPGDFRNAIDELKQRIAAKQQAAEQTAG
ncbi:CvpA family protein [Dehalococcoidia bacterium]|nr:CvpA family protein [Dehalococcoidia bacterium]